MPHRRIEPSGWISRGLSMFLLPIPSGGRAVLTRATDDLLYPAAACGALCLPSRAAAGTRVLARSLGTQRQQHDDYGDEWNVRALTGNVKYAYLNNFRVLIFFS